MKATGIIRKVDELGRVVIPIELRNAYGIEPGDGMEIYTENENIVLRRYSEKCTVCGTESRLVEFGDKHICTDCIAQIKKIN